MGASMKRYGGLFQQVTDWNNLVLAARRARAGKRKRRFTLQFEFAREYELLRLQERLRNANYTPGIFHTHWIDYPKRRLISAAPYRDRVLHHAVINILEPILDRHFHPPSFACRKNKGSHAASRHLQQLLRRYRYSLQFDIRKYFPSIDHDILKDRFRKLIKDQPFLSLLDCIVDASNPQEAIYDHFPGDDLFTPVERHRGLPIGNLTSQWFANWYLDPLDHWLSSHMRVGGFVRYCDDFIVCDNNPNKLRELCHQVPEFLAALRLSLHTERLNILPAEDGRLFVGYRTYPTHRHIAAENKRRFLRRLRWMKRAFATGRMSADKIHQRLMSWLGHAGQADSLPLIRKLAEDWVFVDGKFHHFRSPSVAD
jgi:RNA-directed DNA polymerase